MGRGGSFDAFVRAGWGMRRSPPTRPGMTLVVTDRSPLGVRGRPAIAKR